MSVRTPWPIVKRRLRCYLRGHDVPIPVGVLSRKGGFQGLDVVQCPHCQEMFIRGKGDKLIGGKVAGVVK
jgi:hypothetical protein